MSAAKKILICDDDQSIVEVLQIILEQNGFKVMASLNGKGIEKKISQFKPDLILLDIWMPGIGGKEVIKLLKRNKKTQSIPILVISALNSPEKIAKEVGADDFISKPFEIEDLISKIKNFLN